MLDSLMPYAWVVKLVAAIAVTGTVAYGVHKYNDSLREDGRKEIRMEWANANEVVRKAQELQKQRLQHKANILAKQYYAERDVRIDLQRREGVEREKAIDSSNVAANVCIDDRMRDSWNRANGHTGTVRETAPIRRMDAEVPTNSAEIGR
ncbi:MAG: hypothetical protein E6R03_00075 [Hyphomicrobiaceae bacterium]|nr:MAG: hypothetical protein E6R03_00075 [Hyphomicrobiaceae bacterium]